MKRLKITSKNCTGCKICELLCSFRQCEDAFNPSMSLIKVKINRSIKIGDSVDEIDVPIYCEQCDPAPCAESCPEEAFIFMERLKIWKIDENKCTGCGICVNICPNQVISFHDDVAVKCDLCDGESLCAQHCPTNAIEFE